MTLGDLMQSIKVKYSLPGEKPGKLHTKTIHTVLPISDNGFVALHVLKTMVQAQIQGVLVDYKII